jgi:hypothetical protein
MLPWSRKAWLRGMTLIWKKPWNRYGDVSRIGLRMCVIRSLLNNPRYIFIVQRLSIVSKLDSNNPYRIWAEFYFSNLNYLNKLVAWPIRPADAHAGANSQVNYIYLLSPSCSQPTFWSSQIMVITGTQHCHCCQMRLRTYQCIMCLLFASII